MRSTHVPFTGMHRVASSACTAPHLSLIHILPAGKERGQGAHAQLHFEGGVGQRPAGGYAFAACVHGLSLIHIYDARIADGLPGKNINTMAPVLALSYLYEYTGDETYGAVCKEWAQWVMDSLPKTKEGGFQPVSYTHLVQRGRILHVEKLSGQ